MQGLTLKSRQSLLSAIGLLALVLLVYGGALRHDFLNGWDDDSYVTANHAVRGINADNLKTAFTSVYVGNYAPLQIVSYMVDYALWGMKSSGFLLTNLLLHWANGLLFLNVARRLTKSGLAAFLATFIFLLHPVQVETVVWISQRKNLLAMFFFLIALLAWSIWRQRGSRALYMASLAAFCCAVLAKSVTVVLPGVLVLYDICIGEEGRNKSKFAPVLPFIGVAVVAAALNFLVQDPAAGQGGGRASWHGGSPVATIFTMLPVLVLYLKMIFLPTQLSALYDPLIRTSIDLQVVLAALVLAAVAGSMVFLWRRDRLLFFSLGIFWLCLLPVSQVVPLVTLMNDRYLYFPLLGVAIICGTLLARSTKGTVTRWARGVVICTAGALLLFLPLAAHKRVGVWQNSLTLWSDVVSKTPSSKWGWIGLGEVYRNKGMTVEALDCYEKVLAIDAVSVSALLNIGLLQSSLGEVSKGRAYLVKAVELYPAHAPAYAALGDNFFRAGEHEKGLLAYERALQLDPKNAAFALALNEARKHSLAQKQ